MDDLSLGMLERDGFVVLAIQGDVDLASSPRLREQFIELVRGGHRNVVVDLTAVDFIDSTGLGILVGAFRRLRQQGGDMSVVCTRPRILQLFEITGLAKVFAIHASVDAATIS